ncbi:MAG: hypothetical protein V2G44_07660 [bacterium JZ-2024 1]
MANSTCHLPQNGQQLLANLSIRSLLQFGVGFLDGLVEVGILERDREMIREQGEKVLIVG